MNKFLHILKQVWWKIKANSKITILLFIIICAVVIIVAGFFVFGKNKTQKSNQLITQQKIENINANNAEVNNQKITQDTPYSAIIENLVSIRPQVGLKEASIVYEALVEGGITRFLAVYNDSTAKIEAIGPIRSVRPYFITWAQEHGGIFAHAGGSLEALNILQKNGLTDLDQIAGDHAYFWRSKESFPPHNLFTSSELLWIAVKDKKASKNNTAEPWLLKTEEPERSKKRKEILLNFSTYSYEVRYVYDSETNNYKRFNGGEPHRDKTSGEQLQVKNVIIQRVSTSLVDPTSGLLGMQTEGTGDAFIFLDGKKIEGRWERQEDKTQTFFYNKAGELVVLNPGSVWIEIIPPDRDVLYNEK